MKSLFFVSKPLEMLGAIEARYQFKIDEAILVLKVEKNDKKTVDFLIEKSGNWNNIIITNNKSSYGLSWLKLTKKLKKEKYQYLFTRAFSIAAYFVNNLNYKECYLLDDGAATIAIADKIQNEGNLTKQFSLFRGKNKSGFKYDLIQKIYSLNSIEVEKKVDNINFFTYYDLSSFGNLKFVENKFSWLHSIKKPSEKDENKVYLLGTNVVNGNIMFFDDYLETLNKISQYYREKEIIYIPHGRENTEHLNQIKQIDNLEIRKNKFNVELDFLLNNVTPKYIAGTITTALITLKLIYKEARIDFFNFENEKVFKEKREVVNNLYNYQNKYINYRKLDY